jgi:excisionase family DNA binding protein
MDKKLLTVAEAAIVTGCSRSLLYQRVMRGEIPSIKIGRARRIPVAALEEWIERQLEAEQSAQGQS